MTKHRLTIILMAATSAVLLLFLGLEYGPQIRFAGTAARGPAPAGNPAASAAATDSLGISVFDQPRPLPEINFADGDGRTLTLTVFRGRVVLLNIWATWCVPCRKEMSGLDRLQTELGGDDFIVIPLSIDRKGVTAVERFYGEVGVEKLGIFVDPSSRASHDLNVPGLPTTLLVDHEGREVARKMGAAEWDGPEMVSLIERTIRANSESAEGRNR
jgi:thiol-disulfide isomerase/thioredoxin